MFKRIKRRFFFDDSKIIYVGRTYKSYWEEYYGNAHRPFISAIRVKAQARRAFLKEGFRPDEFYLYGLETKSQKDRVYYLSKDKKDDILISFYGSDWREIFSLLRDKYQFYTCLKDYFKRDVTCIKSAEDRVRFLSFCGRYRQIFAKVNKGGCGKGARKITIIDDEQASAVFDDLVSSGEWIIEEVIDQSQILSSFNSSSINSVRIPSFKRNGNVKCAFPCMRFGRAGCIIDNSTQGGLVASIDEQTGEIVTDAYDEMGNVFLAHPDSKVSFRGFHVPLWDILIDLVKKAHLALPENQVYVAFDFALSEKGWCLVEGNWGDWFLQQLSLKKGLKEEFVSLLMGNK